jgi:ferredoxin-type protein NapH
MRARRWTQLAAVFAANPWFVYLSTRTIYQGKAKGLCFPGFNCYACPLALMSCPIGSLQHSMAILSPRVHPLASSPVKKAASYPIGAFLYVAGFIGLIGIVFGRLACGWICPFGYLQDLLYKIPVKKIGLPSWMRFGKYFALVVVAMLIPFITGVHWYSRLCPAGALEGSVPLTILPPKGGLPPTGWFFWLKIAILVFFLCWMVVTKRPFCRTSCALGGAWALLAPVSLYRMRVDRASCTECGACRKVCPVDINIYENGDSPECIRCLDCKKECPAGAITSGFVGTTFKAGGLSERGRGPAA